MVVGVCRVVFALPGNDSLKGKRKVIRRIVDRTRSRFNVAVAEVADQDALQRAVLGICVVSNDASHANSMLDTIFAFVSRDADAVVTDHSLELLHIGRDMQVAEPDSVGEEWSG